MRLFKFVAFKNRVNYNTIAFCFDNFVMYNIYKFYINMCEYLNKKKITF